MGCAPLKSTFSRLRSAGAFTLVELLVVVLIIAILIAVAAPSFLGQTTKAQDSAAKQYLTVAYKNAKAYATDGNGAESHVQGDFTGFDATVLEGMEPGLNGFAAAPATAEGCAEAAAAGSGDKRDIYIALASGTDLIICNDPDSRAWVLQVLNGELKPLELWLCDESHQCVKDGESAPSEPAVPQNTGAAPSIQGSPAEGQVLTTEEGVWSNSPTSYTYQWLRCNTVGGSCANISGATVETYLVQAADVGYTLRVVVTGVNADGAGTSATSAATDIVDAAPQTYSQKVVADGPVAYYRFEETGSATTAVNSGSAGSSANGTYGSGSAHPTLGVTGGPSGNAASFDGSDTVSLPDVTALNVVGQVTLEAYVKTTASGAAYNMVVGGYSSGSIGYGLAVQNGKIAFFDDGVGWYSSTASVNDGQWHHIAAVTDGTGLKLYKDGVLDSTHGSSITGPSSYAGVRHLGSQGGSANFFNGQLDEVAIYSKALSAAQISYHAGASTAPMNTAAPTVSGSAQVGQELVGARGSWVGTSPIAYSYQWQRCSAVAYEDSITAESSLRAYWRFEDGTGTPATLVDAKGNANATNGSGGSAVSVVSGGQVGTAASFSGTSRATLPSNVAAIDFAGPLTMEAWVKVTSAQAGSGLRLLIGGYNSSSPYSGYAFGLGNNGRIAVWDDGSAWKYSNSVVADGNWHHIAAVFSGSTITFYKDGQADGSVAWASPINSYTGQRVLGMNTGLDTGSAFVGLADEVALYNSALSAATISSHRDAGLGSASNCTDVSGATTLAYTVQAADQGQKLRLKVTATNSVGSTTVYSDKTALVP